MEKKEELLGDIIRKSRIENGLTTQELAKRVDITQRYLGRIEGHERILRQLQIW